MEFEVRKIDVAMYEERLPVDLEQYATLALGLGATHAAAVSVRDVVIDERVTLKCQIPRCFGYGVSAHCPPSTLKPGELRELLARYEWAVFFALDVPAEVIVRDRNTKEERIEAYRKVFEIVSEIESRAFYHGHYLAFGLAAGSCRSSLCPTQEDCKAMNGEKCRFALRSRPSLEAVGVDAYQMVARLGWDIYPIGSGLQPEKIPHGTLAGMVVVQ